MRVFFATDIHGSDACFRKFANAARIYGADAVILGGDLAPKAMVPIVEMNGGNWLCGFLSHQQRLQSGAELKQMQLAIEQAGLQAVTVSREEYEVLQVDHSKIEELFEQVACRCIERWASYFSSHVPSTVLAYWMAGNDDPSAVVDALRTVERPALCESKIVRLAPSIEMISLGFSTVTPFNSPRELTEAALAEKAEELACELEHPSRAVFNFHCPPKKSGLDLAPELRPDLSVVYAGGEPLMVSVGSEAVRQVIEKYQPALGLHGHVHESRSVARVGRTLCLNPGSQYSRGILNGVIVTLDEASAEVRDYQFVSG